MQHITEIIICIITVASFIYGIHSFFKKGVAMYPRFQYFFVIFSLELSICVEKIFVL
jgi:hypothetical protein